MRKNILAIVIFVFLSATNALALRCGLDLATEGDLKHEVKVACGEPISRDVIGYIDEERRGNRIRVLEVEEWILEQKGYYYSLIFEGNVLKKIQDAGQVKR